MQTLSAYLPADRYRSLARGVPLRERASGAALFADISGFTPLTEALDYSIDNVKFSADGKTLWAAIEAKGVVPVFKLNADGTGLTAVYAQGNSLWLALSGGEEVSGIIALSASTSCRSLP